MAIPKGRQGIQRRPEANLAARIQVQELELAPTQVATQIKQPIKIPGLAALRQLLLAPAQDLLAWEQQYGRIPDGAAVLMNSGWATRIESAAAYVNADAGGTAHFPGFSAEAANFLLQERKINGIGVDTLSLDHGPATNFPVHIAFLPTNRWGLECLVNLAQIPPSGAHLFVGVPKIKGSSGGPTRVLAIW